MKAVLDTDVANKLGVSTAVVVECIYDLQPNYDKAKLNISAVARHLSMSLSTVQRVIKSLTDKGYLEKHYRSEYSFTPLFFSTFHSYKVYNVKYI